MRETAKYARKDMPVGGINVAEVRAIGYELLAVTRVASVFGVGVLTQTRSHRAWRSGLPATTVAV